MLILKIALTFLLYFPLMCHTRKDDEITTIENVMPEEGDTNFTVLEKWENIEEKFKSVVKEGIKSVLPMLMENSGKVNVSKECIKSSLHLVSGIKELKPWAFNFFDSSGKFIDGLFTGTFSSFGQYDQCLDIQVKSTKLRDKGNLLFSGQYCSIDIRPPLPPRPRLIENKIPEFFLNFSKRDTIFAKSAEFLGAFYDNALRLGVCIPSKCSREDLNEIVSSLGKEMYLDISVPRCEVKKENEFTPSAVIVITCYCLIGALVLVATVIDVYLHYKTDVIFKSKAMKVILVFSFFTNFKKFSSTEHTKSNTFRCLNGMRFFGMLWIISIHTYIEFLGLNIHNGVLLLDKLNDFNFQIITNSVFSVDMFFFIGGMLVSYITMKVYKNKIHSFNPVMFIIHRILRILPAYTVIIMFSSLIYMFGSGPMWDGKKKFYEPCYKYWWTNLLFINNFYSLENSCFSTTWYIASDFQLYVFSLIIIIPFLRWPKIGIILSVVTIIASSLFSGIETYLKGYPPAAIFYKFDVSGVANLLADFEFKPFPHAGPYAIGLLVGYFLEVKPKIKLTPFIQVVGWSLSFTACYAVVFGIPDWYKKLEVPLVPSIFYASLKRISWSLGIAWIIICCAKGYGGIVNYILSMNIFFQLGRLTFLAYLIHPIVQNITHGNIRVRVEITDYHVIYAIIGHTFVSYFLAFIVHMVVEVPFGSLERMLLSGAGKKEEPSNTGKSKDFLEANINAEKKEDLMAVTFVSDEKTNTTDRVFIANNV